MIRITDLIKELQRIKDAEGDLQVLTYEPIEPLDAVTNGFRIQELDEDYFTPCYIGDEILTKYLMV